LIFEFSSRRRRQAKKILKSRAAAADKLKKSKKFEPPQPIKSSAYTSSPGLKKFIGLGPGRVRVQKSLDLTGSTIGSPHIDSHIQSFFVVVSFMHVIYTRKNSFFVGI
jgi:hypothetical protein